MVRKQLPAQLVNTFDRTVFKNVIFREKRFWTFLNITIISIMVKYIPNTEKYTNFKYIET